MFSSTPQVNGSSTNSARGSRRRQRPLSNEGSIAQPKAKRQRSALSEHTFQALNGDAAPEMEEVKEKAVSVVRRESTRDILVPAPRREIAVRGKKAKTGESKFGDGLVLTTNDTYTVSKLPALPDRLRTEAPAKQHGAIYSDNGYALAITHEHAMVWPYAANVPSPETFTFTLPHPSKHGSDALPLGSLVSASASSAEPGLVVVMPNTGVITYWESIASAATLDLIRQQRNGVELSIPGMLSGETVVQILNAETAGFVLGFSTGRLAYMSVRDGQGRPAISVQFLRNSSGPSSRGLLGSLRNVLSISNLRGDIAAVRAGPAEKVGERNVVVATTKGKLQAWNLHRGGHNSLQSDADGREAIVVAIKDANPDVSELLLESFEVLDFTFTPQSVVDSQLGDGLAAGSGKGVHLLLLTSLTGREATHYFLVEVVLKPEEFMIGTIRTMKSYTTPISRISTSKARLYLPSPALMAFIVFDRAVVLMSMAKQHNSPESQLRAESHLITRSFEDVVDFREDLNVEIVGSGIEEPYGPSHGIEDSKSRRHKAKYPAAVLLVRGGGIVRVAATDVSKLVTSAPQVTAKSKLEQAVFFGTVAENPLSFVGRRELQFEPEELGVAAMELSADILKSATPWIPSVPASLEQNLKKRSAALRDLALHLKSTGVTRKLDRVVRWQLLWDAEKMAAAEEIWTTYNARLKAKPDGQKRGLLTEIIEFIHEDYKTSPVPEIGELDRVRLWFIKDIWNLEIAIPWAYQVIKFTYQDGQKDLASIMDLVSQANDVILGALGGAFAFRTTHTNLYGLQSENLEHGVITTGQDRLPDAWTSSFFITENLRKQAELTGMLLQDAQKGVGHEGQPSQALFDKLRHEAPSVIDLCIRANTERIAWDSAQDNPQCQLQADQIKLLQAASEHNQLILLASGVVGLPDEAMALAEKHCILPVLAEILMSEIVFAMKKQRSLSEGTEDYEHWAKRASDLQTRAKDEFTRFGTRWANALFEYHVSIGAMEELLEKYQDQQAFLTSFLRSRPEYAKVAWINEVTREKDLDKAAETLIELGLQREQDVWSKKVELSLGKLARLAGKKNYSQTNGILIPDGGKAELSATNDQLALLKIQDQIYEHILPSISAAIDDNAEFQLAMEAHGNRKLLKSKAFASFLEDNMNHLIRHEAMGAAALIDLLTLMGENGRGREPGSIRGQEFYLALEASRHGLPRDDAVMLQEVIWRRCFLRDDWSKVNNTDGKDDDEVSEQLRQTALYSTLRACFKNRLFDPDTNIKPLGPMDVLEASTEELDGRFNGLDASIRESIMKDMEAEADALKPFIDTCQLEKWHQSAIEVAKTDFETEVFSKTDDGQVMQEVALRLQDIENDIRESQVERATTLLHSKPRFRPGASTRGNASFRASLKLY